MRYAHFVQWLLFIWLTSVFSCSQKCRIQFWPEGCSKVQEKTVKMKEAQYSQRPLKRSVYLQPCHTSWCRLLIWLYMIPTYDKLSLGVTLMLQFRNTSKCLILTARTWSLLLHCSCLDQFKSRWIQTQKSLMGNIL